MARIPRLIIQGEHAVYHVISHREGWGDTLSKYPISAVF